MPELMTPANAAHFQKFFVLEKMDEFQGIATGVMAAEELDHDNEILDYFGSKPFFQKWSQSQYDNSRGLSKGNVRLQHDDKRPVGRLLDITYDDSNLMYRCVAKIEEPVAKNLLATGVLTGFSIGGDYLKRTPLPSGAVRYIAGPTEVSVCDRPCAPSALFSAVKADGTTELRKFKKTVVFDDQHSVDDEKFDSFCKMWSDSARESASSARAGQRDREGKAKEHTENAAAHHHAAEVHDKKAELETNANHPKAASAHTEAASAHRVAEMTHNRAAGYHRDPVVSPEDRNSTREQAFNHSETAWGKGWDARSASHAGKAIGGGTMNAEQTKSLVESIVEKFIPETPFLERPTGTVTIEQIEPTHAVVWFGDRLFKVAYKEEAGKFIIGDGARLSKAEAKKYQVPQEPPQRVESASASDARYATPQMANANESLVVGEEPHKENPDVTKPAGEADAAIADKSEKDGMKCAACGMQMKDGKCENCAGKAARAVMEKNEAVDASYKELEKQLAALNKAYEELGGTDMTDKERLEKGRSSVASHIVGVEKAMSAHQSAHAVLHKAHDNLLEAHKAAHEAHKVAHDARQIHKAAHDQFCTKVSDHLANMKKVLGGGPESFGEFGAPDELDHPNPEVVHPAGVTVPVPAKAVVDELKKMVEDTLTKVTEMVKGLKKEAPVVEAPAAAVTLSEADIQKRIDEGISKGTKQMMTEFVAAIVAPEPEARGGVGDRGSRRAFSKAEDAGGGDDPARETMSKEDWIAYSKGDKVAIAKAQRCTAGKWTDVPARIMKRRQASA